MSEYIKTGEEIRDNNLLFETNPEKGKTLPMYVIRKWVDLSWLKDIEKHNPLLTIEDVLSLLEEK